jgi:hypothetical protein
MPKNHSVEETLERIKETQQKLQDHGIDVDVASIDEVP